MDETAQGRLQESRAAAGSGAAAIAAAGLIERSPLLLASRSGGVTPTVPRRCTERAPEVMRRRPLAGQRLPRSEPSSDARRTSGSWRARPPRTFIPGRGRFPAMPKESDPGAARQPLGHLGTEAGAALPRPGRALNHTHPSPALRAVAEPDLPRTTRRQRPHHQTTLRCETSTSAQRPPPLGLGPSEPRKGRARSGERKQPRAGGRRACGGGRWRGAHGHSCDPRDSERASRVQGRAGEGGKKEGRQKAYSTRYSQAVSHPSTNQARPCLASEIRRDRARSGWCGRRREKMSPAAPRARAWPPGRRRRPRLHRTYWRGVWGFRRRGSGERAPDALRHRGPWPVGSSVEGL
ncbi:uncharacterized protein LOC111735491, partial [Pteropus vampyrus]|uniref:Uncharacterized protein LOC111735491 n=1 Tax=Pteropus vampyrus TaxID=132908 RepID=A0A6P6C5W5_PTEVA